ncbi:hypothetical protein SCLCIDRAFT_28791 [Scleroderma citrinum Foug A]|uniref:Uncharacterized protein n=1 Tax=Scleroderma citrinum Foug A TaxID=1036808 RepID=A0A0C3DNI5_9AGAM|nr:hypothetical protein SCLCIDRAFT_28791 [Scleroderma citrinum Foug A]
MVDNATQPVDYEDSPPNRTDNEESSDEHSDWEADQRRNLKHEQTQREILVGNYDIDNRPSTPPLNFPSSSSEAEGAVTAMEDLPDGICRKTKRKPGRSLIKVTAPSTSTFGMAGSEESDADDEHEHEGPQTVKPGRLPMEAIRKAQALGRCATEEAEAIANKYGKTLATIMAAAGLSTKATRSESVWNMHQAWYASAHCKQNGESTNDYYTCQLKHYEAHREEEDYPQL